MLVRNTIQAGWQAMRDIDKPVKVFRMAGTGVMREESTGEFAEAGRRFVPVEDVERTLEKGWNEGYQACSDIISGKASPWEGQETCATLKQLRGTK
jgi:hypothetical protein